MLNTKYIITTDQQMRKIAQTNSNALGPAWFVKGINYVKTPATAMKALDYFHPKDSVVTEDNKAKIPFAPQPNPSAFIKLKNNHNDFIEYESNSAHNQFAVFSENIMTGAGKNILTGKKQPIVQTSYVLRGLAVPAASLMSLGMSMLPSAQRSSATGVSFT